MKKFCICLNKSIVFITIAIFFYNTDLFDTFGVDNGQNLIKKVLQLLPQLESFHLTAGKVELSNSAEELQKLNID